MAFSLLRCSNIFAFLRLHRAILPIPREEKQESFQASFLLVFPLSRRWLFMFSQWRVQSEARALIYFGNEGVTTRWGRKGGGSALLLVRPTEPFCIFPSSQQSSPTFLLFTRRISPLSAVFHSFLSALRYPRSLQLLTYTENARFLLFARASSKLLSEWLRRAYLASHPRPFFSLFRSHVLVPSAIRMDIDHY